MTPTFFSNVMIGAGLLAIPMAFVWLRLRQRRGAPPLAPVVIGQQWWQAAVQVWQEEVKTNEWHLMQIATSITCIGIAVSVSYAYVGELMVSGWQLWTWLLCILILTATLLFKSIPTRLHIADWKILLGLAILALVLRATLLTLIPGDLHVDEMGSADFPMRHIYLEPGRTINPFRTGASWQPSLYHYLTRLSFLIFGYSVTGLRISSALAGMLAVLATYAVVAIYQNHRTALISAAIMTTYHYHIQWSRIALNNVWDTVWVPLALAAFAWGWRKKWSGGAVISGLMVGLSHYFYAGSQIVIFLMAFLIISLYRQNRDKRQLLVYGGKFAVMAVAVAAPIVIFALADPETFFGRAQIVVGWKREAIEHVLGEYNLWRYFWYQLWRSLGAFTSVSEVTGFYGPGVPFLIGIAGPLFGIGFFWSLYQRQFIPVLWVLFTTFFGGFLLSGAPSSSHYVVVIPAICWLTAVPIGWLWQKGYWRLALLLLCTIMVTDAGFYFGRYIPGDPRDFIHPLPDLPG